MNLTRAQAIKTALATLFLTVAFAIAAISNCGCGSVTLASTIDASDLGASVVNTAEVSRPAEDSSTPEAEHAGNAETYGDNLDAGALSCPTLCTAFCAKPDHDVIGCACYCER